MRCRFVIIGSGWRAGYYIRIAKKLPARFELCAVYCRSSEKAQAIQEEYSVNTTCSEEECVAFRPDFVVVAVSKSSGAIVARHWMEMGFTVLLETPAGLDVQTLDSIWEEHLKGHRLVVAEQYTRYPSNLALIKLVRSGTLGEVNSANVSLAHDYHAASLIRAFLGLDVSEGFTVYAGSYDLPVTETITRYQEYTDGRAVTKKRTAAVFEFDNGKVAFYDFDSEQYRSPIRKNSIRIQGTRGEVINDRVFCLDGDNRPVEGIIKAEKERIETGYSNPNFRYADEIRRISFLGETLYESRMSNEGAAAGLSEDETAVALLMEQTAAYASGEAEPPYSVRDALQDAYMAILMRRSESTGRKERGEIMKWME